MPSKAVRPDPTSFNQATVPPPQVAAHNEDDDGDRPTHPGHVPSSIPAFEARLKTPQAPGIPRAPLVPRFTPRIAGAPFSYPYTNGPSAPNGSQPLLGGTIITGFDGKTLDSKGVYTVVVTGAEGEPAKARVDFGRLR